MNVRQENIAVILPMRFVTIQLGLSYADVKKAIEGMKRRDVKVCLFILHNMK